jgi:hypothetical protein
VFLSTATGFLLHLARDVITHQPPAWLQTRRLAGPSLNREVLRQFRNMVDITQQEAERLRVPVGSVQIYQLRHGKTEPLVWNLEQFVNQGFDPQSRFQYELRTPDQRIVGYYGMDGKPLPAIIRKLTYLKEQRPNVELTVEPPVRPGAELLVIRLERGRRIVETMQKDGWLLSLDRLPATNAVVASRAVCLPKGAVVIRYAPDTGIGSTAGGAPTIRWFNASLDARDPAPSVAFRWSP